MSRTALATGISGQDRGYLAEQLVGEGVEVHGVVRAAEAIPAHLRALGEALVLHEVDLTDHLGVASVVARVAPSEVYNLLGSSHLSGVLLVDLDC